MTETGPLATLSTVKRDLDSLSAEEQTDLRAKQGIPVPMVELRIVDDDGIEQPWDGKSQGEVHVRGPWVASAYYELPDASAESWRDGWLRTGDIGVIDPDGYLQLTDRKKDMIKSGGEWISSVALENALMFHPMVRDAAVIGVFHPKWQERPLALVVARPGADLSKEDLLSFLEGKVARWWLPDDVVFVTEIPKTSVGKLDKKLLRARFAGHELPAR
jgi:fatty-acyl-CoA synthase